MESSKLSLLVTPGGLGNLGIEEFEAGGKFLS
jgi:hypothetical protein